MKSNFEIIFQKNNFPVNFPANFPVNFPADDVDISVLVSSSLLTELDEEFR